MNSSTVSGLPALDAAGRALGDKLARDHHSQAIALFRFLKIVSGHEDRRAAIGQPIDHRPERAPRQRIDARGRLIQKENVRLMHNCSAEGHALLPSSRQAARDLVLLSLEPRKGKHPANLFFAVLIRHAVDARKEIEVLANRQVVIQREFLRHVTDALADSFRSQISTCATQLHGSAGQVQQPAEHPDGCCLARAIRSEKPVYFSIPNLQADIFYRGECSELFDQICRTDRNLSAQTAVILLCRKLCGVGLLP